MTRRPTLPGPLDAMPARQATDGVFHKGSSSLIYLIHGVTGTPSEMRYVARGLAQRGHDVYVTTLPGHCQRLRDLIHVRARDWQEHVHIQVDYARRHYAHVFVAGLSAGALLSLDVATKVSVDGIGVMSPTFFYDGWNTPWSNKILPLSMRWVPRLFQHWLFHIDGAPYGIKHESLRAEVAAAYSRKTVFLEWLHTLWPRWLSRKPSSRQTPDSASKGYPLFPLVTLSEINLLMNRVKAELAQVTAPTLVLQALDDDMTSPRNARLVYETIASRKKQLIFLEDCYHVITVDKQKKAVVEHLNDFFKPLPLDVITPIPFNPPRQELA